MSPHTWAELTAAYEDSMIVIESAFADKARALTPAQKGAAAVAPRGPDLEALYARLCSRLDQLCAALPPTLVKDGAMQALAPLMFLLDEQVEKRLAGSAGEDFPDCPKLQHFLLDVVDGGDEFYRRAEGLLLHSRPPAEPVIVGLYLFCLRAGFQGRYFDNPREIERLEAGLTKLLGPAPHPEGPTASLSFRRARPPLDYVVVGVGAVVVLEVLLFAVAWVM